ncbi:Hypothetical predicted protein [Olea europaea subsp. europaea]|uniref:Transcription repressor n=1 Tax=Olea europaea subsp. europaea TaxID=158383 RepID=A0A8S0UZK4_OLEEU|nr:Hypothetical predicted protein [Olea europaea subsp. europaea]
MPKIKILSCKRTKTPSFALDGKENEPKLSDVDRFLYENFRSLYEQEYNENKSKKELEGYISEEKSEGVFWDPLPENLGGSDRFFVTPASSSSLMEETISKDTSEDAAKLSDVDRFLYGKLGSLPETEHEEYKSKKRFDKNNEEKPVEVFLESPRFSEDTGEEANEDQTNIGPDDFIRVSTYSLNPYDDFRQSMHEMIQARLENNGKVDWEFMEKLLFCYLNVNAKKS